MKARCNLCSVFMEVVQLHVATCSQFFTCRLLSGAPSSSSKQATITMSITTIHKCSLEYVTTITKLIVEFVARYFHPQSAVGGGRWCHPLFTGYLFGYNKDLQITRMGICFSPNTYTLFNVPQIGKFMRFRFSRFRFSCFLFFATKQCDENFLLVHV